MLNGRDCAVSMRCVYANAAALHGRGVRMNGGTGVWVARKRILRDFGVRLLRGCGGNFFYFLAVERAYLLAGCAER